MPQLFRSRSKGQVACYSCISYIHDYVSRRNYQNRNSKINISELYETLTKGGLLVPKQEPNCAETHPANVPNYYGIDLVFCPNTDSQTGACVKLKGRYKGGQYVYRNCWNKMWIDQRPYSRKMSERCFTDESVQNFLATTDNKICFCEDDLCNGKNPTVLLPFKALFLIVIVFTTLPFY